jgi:hypothetical protein
MSLLLYAMFEYYNELASSGKLHHTQCVEAEIGKLFWRLLIAEIIAVFLWDGFLWDVGKYCIKRKKDEVELAMLVIDFLGTQCLVWVGTPYCPLLPLLGAINLSIKFYVQKTLLVNLQKSVSLSTFTSTSLYLSRSRSLSLSLSTSVCPNAVSTNSFFVLGVCCFRLLFFNGLQVP